MHKNAFTLTKTIFFDKLLEIGNFCACSAFHVNHFEIVVKTFFTGWFLTEDVIWHCLVFATFSVSFALFLDHLVGYFEISFGVTHFRLFVYQNFDQHQNELSACYAFFSNFLEEYSRVNSCSIQIVAPHSYWSSLSL